MKGEAVQNAKCPYIVGITGGIGAGKSRVCQAIAKHGFPIYTSDLEARHIIDTDLQVRVKLKGLLGDDVYTEQGLDRKRVGQLVFSDARLLNKMNQVVHPAVRRHFEQWVKQQTSKMVFLESAILVSSGFDTLCDAIVYITAPQELRIRRVMLRDGVGREDVLRRIANQSEEKSILPLPAIVLNNDETQTIETMVRDLITKLMSGDNLNK